MLDLKAKLLQAGLVTDDQVEKVTAEQEQEAQKRKQQRAQHQERGPSSAGPSSLGRGKGKKGKGPKRSPVKSPAKSEDERWNDRVKKLAAGPKSEQYDAIRGWVERTRIDKDQGIPTDEATRIMFTTYEGTISWLTLEPALATQVNDDSAAICAYMSFNGLRHCVIPADVARDIGKIRPEWPRRLQGAEVLTRPPPEPKEPTEGDESEGESKSDEVVALPGADSTDGEVPAADANAEVTSTETTPSEPVSNGTTPSEAVSAEGKVTDDAASS